MNETDPTPTDKRTFDSFVPILLIVAWIAVQAFVLPRLGIGT